MSHPSSTPTRRTVLLGAAASGTAAVTGLTDDAAADPVSSTRPRRPRGHAHGEAYLAYVGSRTTESRRARGQGITVWRVDPKAAEWTLLQTVPADDGSGSTVGGLPPEIPINPSFLTLSEDRRFLYTVHGDDTRVTALTVDPVSGKLTVLQTVDIGYRNPVHLTIDPTGRWLVVATLAIPGRVVSMPIAEDGRLGSVTSVLDNPGTPGPHKTSQLGPNPHHAVFDPTGRWIAIPDRGLDRVFVAHLDPATGELTLNDPGWVQTRELEGPRHIAFHPRRGRAYMIAELRCDVTTYDWKPSTGTLEPLQVIPTHPPTFTADVRGGEVQVHPSGHTVYASNRSGAGDDSPGGPAPDTIGVFGVRRNGTLDTIGWISTQGIRPRFFGLTPSGHNLYAANEVTDSIAGFDLTRRGRIQHENGIVARTGSPVSIVFTAHTKASR